jgi:Mg2+-importing ATPase
MFSLAVLSLIMDDDPLLPGQILLINLLADFPAMALATDKVDPELIHRPRRWDVGAITRFMLTFGLTGSLFDFLTFGAVRAIFHGDLVLFHTVWFIESVLTGLIILLAVRTRRPIFRSQPGTLLIISVTVIAIIATAIPFLPIRESLGFTKPTAAMIGVIAVIAILYGAGMETAKAFFYRRTSMD